MSSQEACAVGVKAGIADALEEQFGRVPWWLVSTTLHVLVLAVLSLIVVSNPPEEPFIPFEPAFVSPPPEEPPLVDPRVYLPESESTSNVFR